MMQLLSGGTRLSKSGDGSKADAAPATATAKPPDAGKTDLLLRFFDSQFFDEWIALTYLYKSTSAGVQDYLCNRLYTLPEKGLERYLSQLCQLIINRPRSSLERVIIDLCARSLRIAVKVYWLLLAISQDQLKNTYVAELRNQCERAALEGYWEPPFRDTQLLPLSPPKSRWLVTSPRSPIVANGLSGNSFKNRNGSRNSVGSRFGSPMHVTSPPRSRSMERPTSPDSLSGELYSSYSMGSGLEGLICASPSAVRAALRESQAEARSNDSKLLLSERRSRRRLKVELGEGEQVSALIENSNRSVDGTLRAGSALLEGPGLQVSTSEAEGDFPAQPGSPDLRQSTFGATLDFIEALCDASSGLTAFAPEDRQWALRKGLDEINKEIELASRHGVACWFPMGGRNERIVRLAAKDAVLLNSRDKAPFMLIMEVLSENEESEKVGNGEEAKEEEPHDLDVALLDERTGSHAAAGPGPGSESGGSPRAAVGTARSEEEKSAGERRNKSLAMGSIQAPKVSSAPPKKGIASFRSNKDKEPNLTRMHSSGDSFSRGLNTAMAGLQGAGPLISVDFEVLNPNSEYTPSFSEPSSSSTASSAFDQLAHNRACRHPSRAVGVIHEDDDIPFSSPKGSLSLLCTWGVCRGKIEGLDRSREPYVKVHFKVHGGVDLRLSTKAHPSHRRVPSDEAILRMAAQQRVRNLDPRLLVSSGSAPLPDATKLSAGGTIPPSDSGKEKLEEADLPNASDEDDDDEVSEEKRSKRSAAQKKQEEASAVFGERFWKTRERIMRQSPHGRRPGWAATPIIVKSGDDCRQELLAAQLIEAFHDIFIESQLPLYLRPYEVLVTSNRTALIEMVPDTLSLHQLKAKSPVGTSIADHFFAKFIKGTPGCEAAQRNFAESMAAYSIVCYLLQIKDRHNGNILMDDVGHIIHIDFGFMLSNSPGGVNFEAAPFKLTRELLEVLDSNAEGRASEMFDYFKVLCIQGFLACRKHADRIILLVEMMQSSGCPCFKAGPRAVAALRKRFHLTLPESQCVEVVLGLISDSVDAWRTRQYDQYQRVMNGIL